MAATHNHSSPFYSSTAWGVWAFQDVFDASYAGNPLVNAACIGVLRSADLHTAHTSGAGKPIKLAFCSQLLCVVPYEVTRAEGFLVETGEQTDRGGGRPASGIRCAAHGRRGRQ